LNRAGIKNFRWRDFRNTLTSWHVQAGEPLNLLQELGGWSDYRSYAIAHLASHAPNIGTFGTQLQNRYKVT
jgi:hypothetical protein